MNRAIDFRWINLAALVLSLALTNPTHAETLRCGSRLVYEGDAANKVSTLCGEPTQITRSTMVKPTVVWRDGRAYRLPGAESVIPVEEWLYNFGPQKLMRKLRFEDGQLVKIATLEYGYHQP